MVKPALIYFPGRTKDDSAIQRSLESSSKASEPLAWMFQAPPQVLPTGFAYGDMNGVLADAISVAYKTFGFVPDGLLILLEGHSAPLYSALKKVLGIHKGIASQVIVTDKAMKERGQAQQIADIAMKVNRRSWSRSKLLTASQVNIKFGGTNCVIEEPPFKDGR